MAIEIIRSLSAKPLKGKTRKLKTADHKKMSLTPKLLIIFD
jgi:hypothetical protein